jgi:hypothetical protein
MWLDRQPHQSIGDKPVSFTEHAMTRSQQRGVPPLVVNWVRTFGHKEFDHHGAVTRYLDKAGKRRLTKEVGSQVIRQLEAYLDVYVVESASDGGVITIGRRYKRVNRV